MRRIVLFLLVLGSLSAFGQSKEVKEKFNMYTQEGYYKIDGNNIVVSAIIEGVPGSKDEIYQKTKDFFNRYYNDANSNLQTDDRESGIIIGKGYYRELLKYRILGMNPASLSADHALRVDIKDGRVRVIATATEWDYSARAAGMYESNASSKSTGNIVDYAPITDRRLGDKGRQMEAFVILIDKMMDEVDEFESIIKGGTINEMDSDW